MLMANRENLLVRKLRYLFYLLVLFSSQFSFLPRDCFTMPILFFWGFHIGRSALFFEVEMDMYKTVSFFRILALGWFVLFIRLSI